MQAVGTVDSVNQRQRWIDRGQRVIRRGALLPLREAVGRQAAAREDHETIGLGIRQRSKEHGIQDAERGGAGTDAERQRNERDGEEAGRFQQGPERTAEIVEHHILRDDDDSISDLRAPFDTLNRPLNPFCLQPASRLRLRWLPPF